MQAQEVRRSKRLQELREERDLQAEAMKEPTPVTDQPTNSKPQEDNRTDPEPKDDMTLAEMLHQQQSWPEPVTLTADAFRGRVIDHYPNDKMYVEILEHINDHPLFEIREQLIWTHNLKGDAVMCVPRNRELITEILIQAHEV
ncbi:hypothetical protein H0H93_007798, partial [Arthromyces matolae]